MKLPQAKDPSAPTGRLPENRVLKGHQHLVYNIQSDKAEEGHDINGLGHASSNAKLAALAFIIRKRSPQNIQQGLDYIRQNHSRFKDMMSRSHNDAILLEVAKAMNHPQTPLFQSAMRPLMRTPEGHQMNYIPQAHPEATRAFFDAYQKEFMKYQDDFKIYDSRIVDPTGRADPQYHRGTTKATPHQISHLVAYLYKLDNGKTLSSLLNPNDGAHTATYLKGRDKPGNGQLLFAKTGSISESEYRYLPKDSPERTQFPNGVYLLTMGYMQEGEPKMVMFRADSKLQREQLAKKFLDDVAGVQPTQTVAVKRPRPTTSA